MTIRKKNASVFKIPLKRWVTKAKPARRADECETRNDIGLAQFADKSSIELEQGSNADTSHQMKRSTSPWPLSALFSREDSFEAPLSRQKSSEALSPVDRSENPSSNIDRRPSFAAEVGRRSGEFLRAVRVKALKYPFRNDRSGDAVLKGFTESVSLESDPEARLSLQKFHLVGKFFDVDPITQSLTAEELADRREFIVVMAVSLLKFGAATHLTEAFMDAIAPALHVPAQCSAFPGLIIVSFNSPDMDPSKSQTRSLALQTGLDLDKLDAVDSLAGKIVTGECTFKEAKRIMNQILSEPPYYSQAQMLLGFGVSAGMATTMFFGGGWWDGIISFLLGVWVGVLSMQAGRVQALGCILEFVAAMTCSMVARFVHVFLLPDDTCYLSIALGSCVWLLPGLAVTTSVTELASHSIVSGASRIFAAFTVALQLGFGLTVGSRAVLWSPAAAAAAAEAGACAGILPLWFRVPGFFVLVASLVMLLNVRPSWSWVGVFASAAAGHLSAAYLQEAKAVGADTQSFLSAVAVGVVGGTFARLTRRQPLSIVMAGILLLVPGGIGVRGVSAFLANDVISGMQFGFKMFTVALSITIGLLVAKVIVVPSTSMAKPYYQPALL